MLSIAILIFKSYFKIIPLLIYDIFNINVRLIISNTKILVKMYFTLKYKNKFVQKGAVAKVLT